MNFSFLSIILLIQHYTLAVLINPSGLLFFKQPEIQCTVLNIKSNQKLFGIRVKKYDSISNDAALSLFTIANMPLKIRPRILKKTKNFEKIEIYKGNERIVLKITGFPISRKGLLLVNGVKVADITCH